jgi:hypothetical protein
LGKIDGFECFYSRDMATPGFPTFALNEIGDDPSSDQITVQSAADVAHQVVRGIARRPLLLVVSSAG